MATFLIESQHSARECPWVLRPNLRQGVDALEGYHWGCRDGVHVGWRMIEADSKFDVLATIPQVLRPRTRIVQLDRFSPAELLAFHEGGEVARVGPADAR